ncbi:MAG: FAD-dependent thymidylate synthase [Chloroflexota bacterium]
MSRFKPRRIYAVVGVPPEVQAYGMARYSRSSQGMLESIRELSQEKAEKFLETFYFQYGHRSVADLAHVALGIEQISLLSAIAVVDEPVWDGQERSTRYQPFRRTGWYVPPGLSGSAVEVEYNATVEALFSAYEQLSESLLRLLTNAIPRPEAMEQAGYQRTLRARAFDVARYLLPLATHTSVGQIVSARVLERQISRLRSSDYPELQAIGRELQEACRVPAEAPLLEDPDPNDPDAERAPLSRPRATPTLVKYAEPSVYQQETRRGLFAAAAEHLAGLGVPDRSRTVELATPVGDPLDELVATLLYKHDRAGHSYRQIVQAVASFSARRKREILDLSVGHRGQHDEFLREHQAGYSLVFDVLMDVGSFRDLHRHRRCVQVLQPSTWDHGFDPPEQIFESGLGRPVATLAANEGLIDRFETTLRDSSRAAERVADIDPLAADYLMPLAYRTRCLFKMDWAQAAYIIELRTGPTGHFSYRQVAWEMYRELRARYPALAEPIRAVDPGRPIDLLQR